MYNSFTEEARKILMSAKEEMKDLKHPYVGSEHLLLAILKDKNDISDKLREYDLTYDRLRKEIIDIVGIGSQDVDCFLYTPLLKRVMENAIYDSKENNNGNVTVAHLFSAMLEEGEGIAIRIMIGLDIDIDSLYDELKVKPNDILNSKLSNEIVDGFNNRKLLHDLCKRCGFIRVKFK